MKASSRLAATGSRSTSCPPTRIAPPVGRTMPTMLRKVVVFPAPFGPTSPSTSPGATLNDRSRTAATAPYDLVRSEEHTSELQSLAYLVCRLLLEKKKKNNIKSTIRLTHN